MYGCIMSVQTWPASRKLLNRKATKRPCKPLKRLGKATQKLRRLTRKLKQAKQVQIPQPKKHAKTALEKMPRRKLPQNRTPLGFGDNMNKLQRPKYYPGLLAIL